MPWFSLSKASVCLSVTCSPPFSLLLDLAWSSNSPRLDHVTFAVVYTLEGAPRLVRYPAYDPALVVHVLFLGWQVADVADEVLVHHLTVFVEGCLDDVPELVDRAPRDPALSAGALAGRAVGPGLIFASGSIGGLAHGFFTILLGFLSGGVLRSLRGPVGRLRGLTRLVRGLAGSVARALGGLSCGVPNSLRRLACAFGGLCRALAGLLSRLARAFAGRLRGLAGTFAHLSGGLPGPFANLLGGLTGALAHVLHRRFRPGADVFYGFARTLDGFTRAGTDVLDR